MATNLATDSLKSVMSKAATGPTSSVATSDSAVAEFRAHQPLHQDTQSDASTGGTTDTTAQHGTPTLSDSAIAELKAAYVAVEHAIAEAKSGATGSTTDTTGTDKAATDTAATDTASTDKAPTDAASHKTADTSTHQPPAGPLVKVLADATGETTATVQGVLQQVRAVLHQEHLTDASGHDSGHAGTSDTAAGAKPSTGTTTGTGNTSTATDDAKTGDTPHWHDRLIAQHDGSGGAGSTDAAGGQAAADSGSALWQHFLNHYAAADSTFTGNADVVAAVDGFVDTVQSLHLDHGHGQMHGSDGVHLDTAA
ncbi:hypothetical protein [Azospirillum sp. Sh1]|uniref:hypothetical protein n=1 Tax=Azospirillum sp. Sh1 TaxID=2607285 RepID=UPI0011ECDA2B|nr:hypothetical protein [Azospirillum sp. Sh1]KAA0579930.1 hypothetical protein FZ029_06295 [Azospirillum sp. Sh1]